jgi:hypothetical protein
MIQYYDNTVAVEYTCRLYRRLLDNTPKGGTKNK